MSTALQGLTVMVTRPAHQAVRLCELIRAAGGEALAFPVLEIGTVEDAAPVRALLARLDEFDIALFVSSNAVAHAAALVVAHGVPPTLKLAAVGQRTAESLRTRGAELCYAEVYRRLEPNTDLDALRAAHSRIDLIVVTSNDGLRNLVSMAGERHRRWLLDTPLAVISPRSAELAVEMGFVHPAAVAYTATDEALLATIVAWRSTLSANKERT